MLFSEVFYMSIYNSDYKKLSAVVLLVSLLPDSRCKVDTSKIIYFALVSIVNKMH